VKAELEDWRNRATRATSDDHMSAGRIAPLLVPSQIPLHTVESFCLLCSDINGVGLPVQRENDALKAQLKTKEQQVEQIRAELQRRCTAFDCQLQSCCSECTAAVEEHVVATLTSLKKRVENVHKDVDRLVSQKDSGWMSGKTLQLHKAPDGNSKKRSEGLDTALRMNQLQSPSPDDLEKSAATQLDRQGRCPHASASGVCQSERSERERSDTTRSPSVWHEDATTLLS
jgi:hypothetical protein